MKHLLSIILISLSWVIFFSCKTEKNGDGEEARAMFKQAQLSYAAGQPDSALFYFNNVGAKFATSDNRSLRNLAGEAYNTCGVIQFLQGDYPESVNSFLTAEQVGDDTIKARVYNNIASIFHYFNDNEKAMEYLERAAQGALKTSEWDVLRSSTLNILNYCFEVNETGKAVATMERLLDAPLPDDSWSQYIVQTGLGMRAATKDSIPEAKRYFANAIELSSSLPTPDRYRMMSYNHLARTLMIEGRYNDAIACLDTVAEICGGAQQADTYMALCELQADCYKAFGNHKAEYEMRLKYVGLKDSLFSAKEFGKVLNLQSSRKIDRVEKTLLAEKELRINRERMAWVLAILVILVCAVVVWIWLQNKRLREALKVLYEKTKQAVPEESTEETTAALHPTSIYAEEDESDNEPSASKTVIDQDQAKLLADAILKVMDEEKPYLQPAFSIRELADLVGSNSKYVSYALNTMLGNSFPTFVNTYRIREACSRLRDEATGRALTIEAIAKEVGFKSRTGFNATFKKITGLTPKEYIVMAKEDKNR